MDQDRHEGELQQEIRSGEEGPEVPTAADRIIGSVVSPSEAFSGLLAAPNLGRVVGIAALVAILLSFASTVLMTSSELYAEKQEANIERAIEQYGDMEGISDEDVEDFERSLATQQSMSVIMAFVSALLSVPFMLLLLGLVVLAVSKIFERGEQTYIRYIHALAVATLGIIPMSLAGLVLGALQYFAHLDASLFGLGLLAPEGHTALTLILSAFTIPAIWGIAVLGIGTAQIARSSSTGPIATYAGILLVIMALLGLLVSQLPFLEPFFSLG